MLLIKFFYNTDAAEGAGEGNNSVAEAVSTEVVETPQAVQIPLSDLEALGFKSIDELKAHFNKPAEPTDEEKAQAAQREKADFLKYSTEEGLLNIDEYQGFESVKAKADRDLVFENFAQEFREDNPDADEYDVEQAFNSQYHINSDNVTLKKRGEKLLGKEAAELRSPFQSKYETAYNKYQEKKQLEATVPQWNKLVDEAVSRMVPEKMKVFEKEIDGDKVTIDIDLTTADREEIAEKFKMNVKAYNLFVKGEIDKLNTDLSRKISGYIKDKYAEVIQTKTLEQGVALGRKKGSNIGASAPFPMVNNQAIVRPIMTGDIETEIRKSHAEAATIRK